VGGGGGWGWGGLGVGVGLGGGGGFWGVFGGWVGVWLCGVGGGFWGREGSPELEGEGKLSTAFETKPYSSFNIREV